MSGPLGSWVLAHTKATGPAPRFVLTTLALRAAWPGGARAPALVAEVNVAELAAETHTHPATVKAALAGAVERGELVRLRRGTYRQTSLYRFVVQFCEGACESCALLKRIRARSPQATLTDPGKVASGDVVTSHKVASGDVEEDLPTELPTGDRSDRPVRMSTSPHAATRSPEATDFNRTVPGSTPPSGGGVLHPGGRDRSTAGLPQGAGPPSSGMPAGIREALAAALPPPKAIDPERMAEIRAELERRRHAKAPVQSPIVMAQEGGQEPLATPARSAEGQEAGGGAPGAAERPPADRSERAAGGRS